ncbi:hypothetical protein LTR15_012185 [Elasticomyces elasticus]|nr:hypothetical protein LTR15_012185 [Elasticomyces elasticus]
MADISASESSTSTESIDDFDFELIVADQWSGDVDELKLLMSNIRGYVDRSKKGENTNHEIQALCTALLAHDGLPFFTRARLETYMAFSNEGMDEARLDLASFCIDKAIAEAMDKPQKERDSIHAWKKHITNAYDLLVPVDPHLAKSLAETPAFEDKDSGSNGPADARALTPYERLRPLPQCGDRACCNPDCHGSAPIDTPQAEHAGPPSLPSRSESPSSHTHSDSDEKAPLSEQEKSVAFAEARKKATAHIEKLKEDALATEAGQAAKLVQEQQTDMKNQ